MNRIDRITAILIHLQTKRIVKAEEIANRFEISRRTVYRDIKALEEAGIPLGAEAGRGYFIIEGYHLPPVMFTRNEAISMLIAGKFMEKFTDSATKEAYESSLYKIRSVLSSSDKKYFEDLYPHVQIMYTPGYRENGDSCNHLWLIQDAIVARKTLKIEYRSYYKDELTSREVEPIGISYYGFCWHLIAFCRLRNEFRDFRIDRIIKLQKTNTTFEPRKDGTLENYFNNLIQTTDLIEVVLSFSKEIYPDLQIQKFYYGFISEKEKEDRIEMHFLINSFDYMARWVINFGEHVEIIEPVQLKQRVVEIVKSLQKFYL